jgi:hypothetical protein
LDDRSWQFAVERRLIRPFIRHSQPAAALDFSWGVVAEPAFPPPARVPTVAAHFSRTDGSAWMLLIDVYLDKSQIEGIGVFAKNPIAKGTLIWKFDPHFDRLIPNEVWEAQTGAVKTYLDRYCYPSRSSSGHIVFEADDARYMNHSDNPNCDVSNENAMYALKDIAPREELTCDYNIFFRDAGFEFLGER